MKKIFASSALMLFLFSRIIICFAIGENLVLNSDFEDINGTSAKYWYTDSWAKNDTTKFEINSSISKSGKNSFEIKSTVDNDARIKQKISVKPNTYYRISSWVKTQNINSGDNKIGANLTIDDTLTVSRDITGTSDNWEYLELYGKTNKNQSSFIVTLALGGYGRINNGTAIFDNVEVVELNTLPIGKVAASLSKDIITDNSSIVKSKNSQILLSIIAILLIVSICFLIYIFKRNRRVENIDLQAIESSGNIDTKDLKYISIITFVYLIISLFNLGSLHTPVKSWTPQITGESFTLEFQAATKLSQISVFTGLGEGRDPIGKINVDYFNGENYEYLTTLNINSDGQKQFSEIYKWKKFSLPSVSTNKLKFTIEQSGAEYNEFAIFPLDSDIPVKNFKIIDKNTNALDKGSIENLFDEQQMVKLNPSYLDGMYFDEIYHARTAYEFLHHIEPYETTHPPLGKVIMSFGIFIFGMVPFGWRIMGALFGVAMVPAMYIFGKIIFKKRIYALATGILMMFDFMHFTQTRIATIDTFVTLFVILMYYYMYKYFMQKSYEQPFWTSIKPLFLCGLFFGLGVASKWIALYGTVGLGLLFLISRFTEYSDYSSVKNKKIKPSWVNTFMKKNIWLTILACVVFFIIIPCTIYFLSYTPYMMTENNAHGSEIVYENAKYMYDYHTNLVATHPYQSSWWQWPLMLKPMYFYSGDNLPSGITSVIVTMGNPAIWWVGIFTFFIAIFIALKKKDKTVISLVVAVVFQYLPWILVPRIAFIYHYFSIVPFIILLIVYVGKNINDTFISNPIKKNTKKKLSSIHSEFQKLFIVNVEIVYLLVVIILFIIFYPMLSGFEVSTDYYQHLRWLKSW